MYQAQGRYREAEPLFKKVLPLGEKVLGPEHPETLKGHEGHHVQLKAHVYADKNSIHVMSVKMLGKGSEKSSM